MNRETRERIFERDHYRCWYCGRELATDYRAIYREKNLTVNELKHAASVDHLIPRSAGGDESDGNLVTACFPCNARKRDRTVDEYRAHMIRKHDPNDRARRHLESALNEASTPFDEAIRDAIKWLRSRTVRIVFYGERKSNPSE